MRFGAIGAGRREAPRLAACAVPPPALPCAVRLLFLLEMVRAERAERATLTTDPGMVSISNPCAETDGYGNGYRMQMDDDDEDGR